MPTNKLDLGLSALMTAAMIVIAAVVVRREWTGPQQIVSQAPRDTLPVRFDGWPEAVVQGVRMGPKIAAVTVVELSDFQCPFCRKLWAALDTIRRRYPDQVAVVFHHYPLANHKYAAAAARAAECARVQGAFERMYNALFAHQDSLSSWSLSKFARAAVVPDIPRFEECLSNQGTLPLVEYGQTLGKRLKLHGTPTVLVNGWKLARPPDTSTLDMYVRRALAGERLFP
jgi:protein-disulfide isomerase